MRVSTLTWEKVSVVCKDRPELGDVFRNATIDLGPDAVYIKTTNKSFLYSHAKLVKLSPYDVVIEACWWSAKFAETDTMEEVPVLIHGIFDPHDELMWGKVDG